MNNPTPPNISDVLKKTHPIPDPEFQDLLEDRLLAEWYRNAGHSPRKRKLRPQIPMTYIAALCIGVLVGVMIMVLPLRPQAGYLGEQPQATPVPTPLPTLQPVPAYIPSELSLTLEPDMVAIAVPINLETNDDTFTVGDTVDILVTLNREQLDTVPDIVYSEVAELLDTHQVDNMDIQIMGHVNVIGVQNDSSIIIFQVSQQDAVVLTWLINSHIPITLSKA